MTGVVEDRPGLVHPALDLGELLLGVAEPSLRPDEIGLGPGGDVPSRVQVLVPLVDRLAQGEPQPAGAAVLEGGGSLRREGVLVEDAAGGVRETVLETGVGELGVVGPFRDVRPRDGVGPG